MRITWKGAKYDIERQEKAPAEIEFSYQLNSESGSELHKWDSPEGMNQASLDAAEWLDSRDETAETN